MKRSLVAFGIAAIIGFVVGGMRAAEAATPRPSTEFAQVQTLNGVPLRWTLPDGGQAIIIAASGQACIDLTGSGAQVVMLVPEGPINLCVQPTRAGPAWDGGCNTIDTDVNFGTPLQAWVPQYVTLEPTNNSICAASDAGVLRVPLFRMY